MNVRSFVCLALVLIWASGCGEDATSDSGDTGGDQGVDSTQPTDGLNTPALTLDADEVLAQVRTFVVENDIVPLPAAPEVSPELYALGESLAFDRILSGNEDISCTTCHHPDVGSDDDRHLSLGAGGVGLGGEREGGATIARNSQPLFNLDLFDNMFWDGRVEVGTDGRLSTPAGEQLTDEMAAVFDYGVVSAQAMFPVTDALEMRGDPGSNELADLEADDFTGIWAGLMTRLGQVPEYVEMFEAAYPGVAFADMNFAHAANAIAGFEIAAFDLRDNSWQRFVAGDDAVLNGRHLEAEAGNPFESGLQRGYEHGYVVNHNGLPNFAVGRGIGSTFSVSRVSQWYR